MFKKMWLPTAFTDLKIICRVQFSFNSKEFLHQIALQIYLRSQLTWNYTKDLCGAANGYFKSIFSLDQIKIISDLFIA